MNFRVFFGVSLLALAAVTVTLSQQATTSAGPGPSFVAAAIPTSGGRSRRGTSHLSL